MAHARTQEVVVGLDVGTTKICAVVARAHPGGGLHVVGVGTAPSRGLRKGVVVNIDATVEAVKLAVAEAERAAGVEVAGVYAGVAGGHVRSVNTRAVVSVAGKDREVTTADVARATAAARAIELAPDREILHVLPQVFTVDDGEETRDPVGMAGARLAVEAHVVTGAVTAVQNVIRSVNRAGLAVHDVVLEPLASAEAVLHADEKELGVLLVDIGGGTTDVALFREGAVWHTAILPLGGDHITNDLAVGLRAPAAEAEELKRRHGCALTTLVHPEETLAVASVGGRRPRELGRQVLAEIVQARVEEIFMLIVRDLAEAGFHDAIPAGVVVTGGSSIVEGLPELAEAIFDAPVRRGLPETVGGLVDVVKSPIYATGVGLAIHGAHREAARRPRPAPTGGGPVTRLTRRLTAWLDDLL